MNKEDIQARYDLDALFDRLQEILLPRGAVAEFSRRTGLSEASIRHWQQRVSIPSCVNLVLLAKAAEVNPYWLLDGNASKVAPEVLAIPTGEDSKRKDFFDVEERAIRLLYDHINIASSLAHHLMINVEK